MGTPHLHELLAMHYKDGNCLKGLYKGYKYFQLAKNGHKCLEMVESALQITKMDRNC